MKKILAHLSYDNKNYLGILKYLSLHSADLDVNITSLHGNTYDIVAELQPDYIILPAEEYSQEFHDFVIQNDVPLLLHLYRRDDKNIKEIVSYMENNKKNIRFMSSATKDWLPKNLTIFYDQLYDNELFYNQNLERNNKIAVLLHNKEANEKIRPLLLPNTDLDIVCFNNKDFDHPQNLGILSDIDLAKILNTFPYVVDLSQEFLLESLACGCSYIDISDLEKNIPDKILYHNELDFNNYSIKQFIENTLLSYLTGDKQWI